MVIKTEDLEGRTGQAILAEYRAMRERAEAAEERAERLTRAFGRLLTIHDTRNRERDQARAWSAAWKLAAKGQRARQLRQRGEMAVILEKWGKDKVALEQSEAAAAQMREALEAVEWQYGHNAMLCPWCGGSAHHSHKPGHITGHAPDCPRQAALSGDAGRGMLKRLRELEQVAEAAQEFIRCLFIWEGSIDIVCDDEDVVPCLLALREALRAAGLLKPEEEGQC
jgi:hypothetical protein